MKSTTDLWFASYLRSCGVDVADFAVIGARRGKYFFALSDSEWKTYRLQFLSSELSKIKQIQEELKDLLY